MPIQFRLATIHLGYAYRSHPLFHPLWHYPPYPLFCRAHFEVSSSRILPIGRRLYWIQACKVLSGMFASLPAITPRSLQELPLLFPSRVSIRDIVRRGLLSRRHLDQSPSSAQRGARITASHHRHAFAPATPPFASRLAGCSRFGPCIA